MIIAGTGGGRAQPRPLLGGVPSPHLLPSPAAWPSRCPPPCPQPRGEPRHWGDACAALGCMLGQERWAVHTRVRACVHPQAPGITVGPAGGRAAAGPFLWRLGPARPVARPRPGNSHGAEAAPFPGRCGAGGGGAFARSYPGHGGISTCVCSCSGAFVFSGPGWPCSSGTQGPCSLAAASAGSERGRMGQPPTAPRGSGGMPAP